MKSIKEKKGITLIALAVTIVVILILAGVTIDAVFSDNGIINKAKEAADRMNNLVKEDEAELNELLNELNETMDSNWNSNIEIPEGNNEGGGENTETDEENIGDLIDDGTIQIGDYVAYQPSGDESYTISRTYSGASSDQKINKDNLNWRVWDKTKEGNVRLISETATSAKITLNGANGYNNGVYLLDDLCNSLYKSDTSSAQNLKIEDIQSKMNLQVWDYKNTENYNKKFSPSSKEYPLILAQEKLQTINGRTGTLSLSVQNSLVTGSSTASSWSVTNTKWNNIMGSSNYIEGIYYEMLHGNNKLQYWLSSRSVFAESGYAFYSINYILGNNIENNGLFTCGGANVSKSYGARPIITLDLATKVILENNSDGKKPETAWIIK